MGGALKKSQVGSKWVHLTCALWIPEIGIGNIEKMEPITKLDEVSVSILPQDPPLYLFCVIRVQDGTWCAVYVRRRQEPAFSAL